MRHEQIKATQTYDRVNIAAVWPASPQIAPLPIPDIEDAPRTEDFHPTESAPDVPAAVGGLLVAAYLGLIGTFALATVASAHSAYMVVIAALFVVTFFTVPRIFFGQEPTRARRPSLSRFMAEGMETLTGHSTGGAALVQMLVVPVSLIFGALAMGIAAAYYM